MARRKVVLLLGISYVTILTQGLAAFVISPEPSLEIFFPRQDATNQSIASTTLAPTISERIQASLNNVLRIPLPLWGTVVVPETGGPVPPTPQQQQQYQVPQTAQMVGGNLISERQQGERGNRPSQHPQLIGAFRHPGEAQPAPTNFLPDVNQAIHSTIAQLSTLSHWPFGYVTTSRPQKPQTLRVQSTKPPTQRTTQATTTTTTTTPPPPSTTTAETTTAAHPTTVPSTPIPAPPLLPSANPTQPMTPSFVPAAVSSLYPLPPVQSASPPKPLPDRIQDRLQSFGNYIRLPNLSQIGQPRPRPMITEPPWVTELLGPTKEPPTTRAPTFGERIRNSVENVLLFVPATLLNFWYENWGTQHVDRFIHRLQVSTPKPGSPVVQPVIATISQNGNNPFLNFTAANLTGNGNLTTNYPTIAAFINTNGTLMPTIVHPVVNMTANTIEYQLRSDNETTVLWTGSLSNDVFFGNNKLTAEEIQDIEDDEEEQELENIALKVKKDVA